MWSPPIEFTLRWARGPGSDTAAPMPPPPRNAFVSVGSLLQRDVLEVLHRADGTRDDRSRAPLELLRPLGSGAHGTVHLARRRGEHGFERLVAVKVLTEAEGVSADLQQRFFHEARLLGMLRHRAIVAADDLVTINGSPALVMEYVDGQDLSTVAKANRRAPGLVPLAWLAHVGMEVTTALQAAWESLNPLTGQPLRALHCDVKPSNIRITPAGSVKLLDFGVAHSRSSQTAAGSVAGTRAYLPPERWVGGPATPSSDLFALGMTLLVTAVRCDHRTRPTGAAESQAWVRRALQDLAEPYVPLRPVLRLLLDSDASQRLDQGELLERLHGLARADSRRLPLLHAAVLAALEPAPSETGSPPEPEPSAATEHLSAPVTTPLGLMAGPDATTTSWSPLDVGALATFSGPFTLEAAAAVLGPDPAQAAGALRRLLSGGEVARQQVDGVPLLCAAHPDAARQTLAGLPPETQAALRLRHATHFAAVASDRWLQEVSAGVGPAAPVQEAIEAELAVAAASAAPRGCSAPVGLPWPCWPRTCPWQSGWRASRPWARHRAAPSASLRARCAGGPTSPSTCLKMWASPGSSCAPRSTRPTHAGITPWVLPCGTTSPCSPSTSWTTTRPGPPSTRPCASRSWQTTRSCGRRPPTTWATR